MPNTEQILAVQPLRGLDQRSNASPQQASIARDLTWDGRDGWAVGPGFAQLTQLLRVEIGGGGGTDTAMDSWEPITSLHWFAQHNGRVQWLVFEDAEGTLKYWNGSTPDADACRAIHDLEGRVFDGSDRERHVKTVPWIGTQSRAYNGRLYLVNGTDDPLVFDGWKAERAGWGVSAPTPDAFLADKTTGNATTYKPLIVTQERGLGHYDKKSGYRYKVTFVNDRGQESPPGVGSDIVTFTNTTTGKWPVVLLIPIGPPGTTARRVYRTANIYGADEEPITKSEAVSYYFLAEIQDNKTERWTDIRPDSDLGALLIETDLGLWPRSARLIAVFKNTMFLAGGVDGRVRFSRPGFPEVFPELNFFDVADDDSSEITGLYPTDNALVVFKTRGIYLIKGDPAGGFYAQTLTREAGAAAQTGIVAVPGVGLGFMSSEGDVRLLVGALENVGERTQVVRLSTPIPDEIRRINTSALENVRAVVNYRDREVWWCVPTHGSPDPDLILCFHYDIKEWSTKENYPISAIVSTADHRNYLIFGSYDADYPGLYHVGHGWGTKQGATTTDAVEISARYQSAGMAVGNVFSVFEISGVLTYALGYGDNELRVDVLINGDELGVYEALVNQARENYHEESQQYPSDPEDGHTYYNTVTWDETGAIWKSHHDVVIRSDLRAVGRPPIHELRLDFQPQGARMLLQGYALRVLRADRVQTMSLSSVYGQDASR